MKPLFKTNRPESQKSQSHMPGSSPKDSGNTGRTAFITGASSGIGEVFAWRYAREGFNLVLTGRQKEKLEFLSEQLQKQFNVEVSIACAELSCESDIERLLRIINDNRKIFVLVNNAGFGAGKDFSEITLDGHIQMVNVHVLASIKLIYAVLPQMIDRQNGTIINVSSMAAYTPAPGSCTYSATKMFLLSFTESLAMEVKDKGITVKCLCPGFTETNFHERLDSKRKRRNCAKILWMRAETVVDKCLRSLASNKTVYVPGFANRLMIYLVFIIPRRMYALLIPKLAG